MATAFSLILIQAAYYFVVLMLGMIIIGFVQRGFFFKFIKVRISFGRLILVKLRNPLRDHFSVGHVEDSFLLYKLHKEWRRHSIPKEPVFYRSIGCTWVDLDEETGGFCKPNYSTIDGFDPVKFADLYKRALYKPAIANNQEKIIIGMLLLVIIGLIAVAFFMYKHEMMLRAVQAGIAGLKTGTIVAAGGP